MTFSADEFIRRFVLHALPQGFTASATVVFPATATGKKSWPCAASHWAWRPRRCSSNHLKFSTTSERYEELTGSYCASVRIAAAAKWYWWKRLAAPKRPAIKDHHYEGHDSACNGHVYQAGMGFVDPGGDHIHILRIEGSVEARTVAVQVIPASANRRIEVADPRKLSRLMGSVPVRVK